MPFQYNSETFLEERFNDLPRHTVVLLSCTHPTTQFLVKSLSFRFLQEFPLQTAPKMNHAITFHNPDRVTLHSLHASLVNWPSRTGIKWFAWWLWVIQNSSANCWLFRINGAWIISVLMRGEHKETGNKSYWYMKTNIASRSMWNCKAK